MGLVFRLEVQVGAAVLVEYPPGRVAHDGIFGFVHFGEDVVQGFQLLGREARLGEKSPSNGWGGCEMSESGPHWTLTTPPSSPRTPNAGKKVSQLTNFLRAKPMCLCIGS